MEWNKHSIFSLGPLDSFGLAIPTVLWISTGSTIFILRCIDPGRIISAPIDQLSSEVNSTCYTDADLRAGTK
jgi:hypothetical protein